jgi:muramoyltetrapeptide carboxypeptidase
MAVNAADATCAVGASATRPGCGPWGPVQGAPMPPSVFLWCPAYTLPPHRLEPARQAAGAFAEAIGASLIPAADLGEWAGIGAWPPAESRRATFQEALRHQVLLAARGGYGCLDLLETLSAHAGPLPLLIGYSDLTILHAAWSVRGAQESLYGFMPGVPHGPRSLASTITLWRGDGLRLLNAAYPDVMPLRSGTATGPLVVGCLRVLTGLVGTPWMPDLRGRILAIEDIDERAYRIDRDLQQLHLAGCLAGVVGLVANHFPAEEPEGYQGPSVRAVLCAWAERLKIPAIMALPFGHHADPVTLPWGRRATVRVDDLGWSLEIAPR